MTTTQLHFFCLGLNDRLKFGSFPDRAYAHLADYLPWHRRFLALRGYDYYQGICKHGHDLKGVEENIEFFKQYFGPEYFEKSSEDWLIDVALPSLEARAELLSMCEALSKTMPKDLFNELLNFQFSKPELQDIHSQFQQIYPQIKHLKKSAESVKDLSQLDLGSFKGAVAYELEFLKGLRASNLPILLKRLKRLISDCHDYLNGKHLFVPSRASFLNFEITPTPHHLSFVLYPFSFMMYAFFETEKQFLEGALHEARPSEVLHIERLLNKQLVHEERFLSDPESLKRLFCRDSTGFMALFRDENS